MFSPHAATEAVSEHALGLVSFALDDGVETWFLTATVLFSQTLFRPSSQHIVRRFSQCLGTIWQYVQHVERHSRSAASYLR